MKEIIKQLKTEKARVKGILEELRQAISIMQLGEEHEFLAFTEKSKHLQANDLISECCSEEELHQHCDYYAGYLNGLKLALFFVSTSKNRG